MLDTPYLQWPVFRRSVVAAFQRSLTHDEMLRRWVLSQLEEQLPDRAADVITSITKIEDLDYFEEHGYPR
jgi:hypothetical protein